MGIGVGHEEAIVITYKSMLEMKKALCLLALILQ